MLEVCCNCELEFKDETEYVCSECREPMCSYCWQYNSGMCDECYDKSWREEDEF